MKTKANKTDSDELNYPIVSTGTSATNYTLHYPGSFSAEVIEFDKDKIDALFENEHFIKKLKQFMFKETLEKL